MLVVFIFTQLCNYVDSHIIDLCVTENKKQIFNQPVYLKNSGPDFSRNLLGLLLHVEIFKEIPVSAKLLIKFNNNYFITFNIHVWNL